MPQSFSCICLIKTWLKLLTLAWSENIVRASLPELTITSAAVILAYAQSQPSLESGSWTCQFQVSKKLLCPLRHKLHNLRQAKASTCRWSAGTTLVN